MTGLRGTIVNGTVVFDRPLTAADEGKAVRAYGKNERSDASDNANDDLNDHADPEAVEQWIAE